MDLILKQITKLMYKACFRSCWLYGCETQAIRSELDSIMEMTEMTMMWCLPERNTDQHRTAKINRCVGNWRRNEKVQSEVAYVEHKRDASWPKAYSKLVVERTAPVGRQMKTTAMSADKPDMSARSCSWGHPRPCEMIGRMTPKWV